MTKKKQLLNESWLEMLGSWSKSLLNYMYDDPKMVATLKSPNISLEEDQEASEKSRSLSLEENIAMSEHMRQR